MDSIFIVSEVYKYPGMSGIAQFQAKETTEIPKEVFDGILNEIKKERITGYQY